MPYVTRESRESLEQPLQDLLINIAPKDDRACDGELNYLITRIVASTLGPEHEDTVWSYVDIARAVAVFECAKLEFYRRIAARKEDRAINTNGDIPEYEQ